VYSLIGKFLTGLIKSSATVGSTAIKTSKALKAKAWMVADLETTPWLYGPERLQDIAKEAIKSKDEHALVIVEEYLLRHGVEKLGRYRTIFKQVREALRELGPEDFL
jgi:hypothetical protein